MSWYEAGTVTSVAGTNVITGVGTLWNNPIFGIAPGQMIFIPGSGQVVIYEILAVDSDTKIRITRNIATAITNSEYAIVTTVSNSMSDLARRTAVQLALYQKLLEDWQDITTGTGDVTIIAPDGSTVVIPALSWISDSKTWFDANKELIEGAGEAVAGAEAARDQAVAANAAAQEARQNASDSATTAINAADSITGSVALAQAAAATATSEAAAASTDADRAEAAADAIDMDVLNAAIEGKMPKSGGVFAGPVTLAGDATTPLMPVTKQQLDAQHKFTIMYPEGSQASPYSFPVNTRRVYVNPFPGRVVKCIPEVYVNGVWGNPGWIYYYSTALAGSFGTTANQTDTLANIVVVSGTVSLSAASNTSGSPHNSNTSPTTALPLRIKVFTIDGGA
ncbi:TPA: hypothetical protein U5D73_000096 [Yersinia enterocolitica]|nr:hypothetical protein [Yersinia enterocolitica]HDL7689717.1 hypothetical protein [Yersinia enterocolitica]HDL7792863.1 hypothetical protein [Yersinia enterocolitica]HDL8193834.1 hypothetical protein [Yersinia enterocolitica]HDM8376352.1 hypothetical protein [Yersinia enterocolitica]